MHEWVRAYRLLLLWRVLQYRAVLPIVLVAQTLLSSISVLGLAMLVPSIDPLTARYLATGGPTIALMSVGLVGIPSAAASERVRAGGDYVASLPVPRLAELGAQMTVFLGLSLPGMALGLVVSKLRFRYALEPTLAIVPAVLVVALTSAAVGYAMALALRQPLLVTLASNVLLFGTLLFAPINFPAERLPLWLARAHEVLPMAPMAQLVRWSLTGTDQPATRTLGTIAAWCVASLVTASIAVRRRA